MNHGGDKNNTNAAAGTDKELNVLSVAGGSPREPSDEGHHQELNKKGLFPFRDRSSPLPWRARIAPAAAYFFSRFSVVIFRSFPPDLVPNERMGTARRNKWARTSPTILHAVHDAQQLYP